MMSLALDQISKKSIVKKKDEILFLICIIILVLRQRGKIYQ